VVNDHPRTGRYCRKQPHGENSHLRLLESGELPDGWVGKNHALWLAYNRQRVRWLLSPMPTRSTSHIRFPRTHMRKNMVLLWSRFLRANHNDLV